MATSGSTDFQQTAFTIVKDAFTEVTAHPSDQDMDAADLSFCLRKFNAMIKAWNAQGIHLWKVKEATLFLRSGVRFYDLGATGDKAAIEPVETTLSADAATSATTPSLTSTTGIAANDVIGIELDDNTIHWTTVASIGPVALTAGLASAASSGLAVYAYPTTAAVARPQRITGARYELAGNEYPLEIISRAEYEAYANKTATGSPNSVYYDPRLGNGRVFLWPAPDDVSGVVRLTCELPIEDIDDSSDNADFPAEWTQALVCNLAYEIAPSYGVWGNRHAELKGRAMEALDNVIDYDREYAPVTFQPAY